MCRIYLGKGVEKIDFEKYFLIHLEQSKESTVNVVKIVWDYDLTTFDFLNTTVKYLETNFQNVRALENGYIDIEEEIILIKDFYKIPLRSQRKIVDNIMKGKFHRTFILMDKKCNINKYNDDLLDEFIHYNVKASM
ncbi:Hypothetical protein CM240_1978 [Clostridium bornimense]|uniref:Uncharacterized protein n=1 Tax=Clostridium bornimense TaxID=1216932 RepID=W6RWS7_9CLOT|nr:hypothetical protein [Clostridium bornimense]CDM69136.1 Hypothetical protein CM240_1978 [Clostridium bornimense]